MFIAMNRFAVKLEYEDAFVTLWRSRDSYLDGVDGFISFNLMRGEAGDNVIDFATHTVWVDEKAFREWVKSDAFKRAHQGPRPDPDMFAEPNKLELFESVL